MPHPSKLARITAALALGALSLAPLAALRADDVPNTDDAKGERNRSVIARAAATGRANTLVSAVYLSGLLETLRSGGSFTLFAPTDEAFAKLPEADRARLLRAENQEQLAELLKYHVVAETITAEELATRKRVATLNGGRLTVAANGHGIAIDEATVVKADIVSRNGVVHLIDRVLMPPKPDVLAFAGKRGFGALVAAVKAAGLEDALQGDGPFTVFAPTDEAFGKLGHDALQVLLKTDDGRKSLAQILKLHVVEGALSAHQLANVHEVKTLAGVTLPVEKKGDRLFVGGVPVIAADNEVGNGVVHAVGGVILPPKAPNKLLDVAASQGNFTILAAALKATGLDEALAGDGPFTVFAPTDAAFAKLGKAKLAELTKPENRETLTQILKYHVVAGRVSAREAAGRGQAKTLLGPKVSIGIERGRLVIGGAGVEATDVEAANGLIHVLDAVLIPE